MDRQDLQVPKETREILGLTAQLDQWDPSVPLVGMDLLDHQVPLDQWDQWGRWETRVRTALQALRARMVPMEYVDPKGCQVLRGFMVRLDRLVLRPEALRVASFRRALLQCWLPARTQLRSNSSHGHLLLS